MSHEEHQNAAHGSHGSGYGGAPKGYTVQHSPADENKRGREEGELHQGHRDDYPGEDRERILGGSYRRV